MGFPSGDGGGCQINGKHDVRYSSAAPGIWHATCIIAATQTERRA
jgi:hypothetical protein